MWDHSCSSIYTYPNGRNPRMPRLQKVLTESLCFHSEVSQNVLTESFLVSQATRLPYPITHYTRRALVGGSALFVSRYALHSSKKQFPNVYFCSRVVKQGYAPRSNVVPFFGVFSRKNDLTSLLFLSRNVIAILIK